MPKQQKPTRTLVLDNGAYNIKAGYATPEAGYADCAMIPNCIARSRDRRVLVGAQVGTCKDYGGMAFRRPVEKVCSHRFSTRDFITDKQTKGYLVNWEAEKEIWDRTFLDNKSLLACDPSETSLVLTEAPNAPLSLQSNTDQMVFEEYDFASYTRCVGTPPPSPLLPAPR